MRILITGVAGFIGFHLCKKLLEKKIKVYGIDNINEYYDIDLKKDRLKILKKNKNFFFKKLDLSNKNKINSIVKKQKINYIIHLAAQAGVRYSIQNPESYYKSNVEGFFNILEISRENKVNHLLFASTSSVYGNKNKFPLKETDNTDKPLSFYAATKKTNEVMAYSYANIYKLPSTALRFFTVYGPYGRPDMSLFKFTKNILLNKPIQLFNSGNHERDFTYIDDIIEGITKLIKMPSKDEIPYDCFNISNGKSNKLLDFLNFIEIKINKKIKIQNLPLQKGDVKKTHGSIAKLNRKTNYKPNVNINKGVSLFVEWYKKFYF